MGLLFFVLIPYSLLYLNELYQLPSLINPLAKTIGIALILIGTAVFTYCTDLFVIFGRGTPAPLSPPKKLVVHGLYQYTRNPIYIGYTLILFGEFLFFGGILLLIYAIVMFACINAYVISYEEPRLKKRFGNEYEAYMKRVPRWIKL